MVSSLRNRLSLAIALLLAAIPAVAAPPPLPPNLQLGAIPRLADGGGWSLAVPLGVPLTECRLETAAAALHLESSPDGAEAWLVFEPAALGPVSAFLEIRSAERSRRLAVAGEVIPGTLESLPPVLIVSADGSATDRRYLRCAGIPAPTDGALDRTRVRIGPALAGGWVPLEVEPGFRVAESRGWLRLGVAGPQVALQYSVVENITVLASTDLPDGWVHDSFLRLGETLGESGLRGRVALLGKRDGLTSLRFMALDYDPVNERYEFRPRFLRELPGVEGDVPLSALSVRVADLGARQGARRLRFVTLGDRTATLWDPAKGRVARARTAGLRAGRAVAASRLHRGSLFAVRTDLRSGDNFLRRWRVVDGGDGRNILRGRKAEASLEARLGVRGLRAFALRARRNEAAWPEKPVTEQLLLLAARSGLAKARSALSLYTLDLDPDDPSRILSARRRFQTRVRWTGEDPSPYLRYARGQIAGKGGFPARAEVGIAGITPGRYIDITGIGEPFAGSPYVTGVRHSIDGGAFGFEVPVFMGIDNNEGRAVARRYRYSGSEAVLRAAGELGEVRGIAMLPSRRMRHAWALTRDLKGVRRLRLLTNGTPAGVNLPPRLDAGADLRARSALVRLRARAFDPNGDPLAIRWSAPGVEFGDPHALVTEARFPEGMTQVRVAVRESGGTYGAVDVLNVRVTGSTPVGRGPGLATRITGLYPNPANPRLRVAFTLDGSGPVRVAVYDVGGRLVRTVLDEVRPTGAYDVDWDGRDDAGQSVASGIYLVKLTTADRSDTRRGVIVR